MTSPEHEFVTQVFLECVEEMARSGIYSYTEADRGRFDFACLLDQHKERSIIGQTLRSHSSGIEKDLNWLLLGPDSSVPVYLYTDTTAHRSRIGEVVSNAQSRLCDRVSLLRLYPFEPFDADDESQRSAVQSQLKEHVVDDLLLNVVFGQLDATDIAIYLNAAGMSGLMTSVLETIASDGFLNYRTLSKAIGVSPSTIRPRIASLLAAGMIETVKHCSVYRPTHRGRVFLRIAHILSLPIRIDPQTQFILDRIGLPTPRLTSEEIIWSVQGFPNLPPLTQLENEIRDAYERYGVTLTGGPYEDNPRGLTIQIGRASCRERV